MATRIPNFTVETTPPVAPLDNDLWWNSASGFLYVWYNDGSSSQWVPANPAMGADGPVGPMGPAGPEGPIGGTSIVSVLNFGGVMGGPAAANTTALQAAVATGKMVHIPSGTFTINPTTFTTTVRLIGEGNTSILQWAPGVAASSLILVTGVGSAVELRDLVIDGSFQSFPVNAGYHAVISFRPTASGFTTRLSAHNCTFINGREWDVQVVGSLTSSAWVKAEFVGCRFRDGVEGQAGTSAVCIGCNEDVDLLITGCTFDGPIANGIGRCGLVYQQSNKQVSQQQGSVVVSGNTFRNMGFAYGDGSIGGLGSCDVYSGASQVSITGNRIINPYGRGICVKGDASDIAITGNVVSALQGGVFSSMCIVVFSSQAKGTAGSRCVIGNNTCQADDGGGIFVDGADYATNPDVPAYRDVVISGNVVTANPAGLANPNGIAIRNCIGVKVSGNIVRGGSYGIIEQGNCAETITIENNDVRGCGVHGIAISASTAVMDVAILNNYIQSVTTYGVSMAAVNSFQIRGNTLKNGGSGGLSITAAPAKTSVIHGNMGLDNVFAYSIPATALIIESGNVWLPSAGFSAVSRTIAAGVITINGEMHYVATEGGAATDDLVTVNGGREGQILVLCPASSSNDVVLKDGGGNLILAGDFTLTHTNDSITLQKISTSWVELSRSDNAA